MFHRPHGLLGTCGLARNAPRRIAAAALPLALAVALAAGCAETGDYRRPASTIPSAWRHDTGAAPETPAARIPWRAFFLDPRLQALVASALEHNSDLRMALARVAETRAQYGIVSADRLPSASLAADKTKSKIPGAFTGTDRPVTTERNELNLTVVSFELDFWGRVASLSEAARASYLASESASRTMRIALIAEVAGLYFTQLELDERITIAKNAVESRRKNRDLVRRGMELGAAPRSDYLLAEGSFHSAKAELAVLENQHANAGHALLMLVGNPSIELPAGKKLHEQDVRNDLAPGIPSEVLYARPDVIAAEHRLREAHANIAAARAAFLPKILLTVGVGLASRSLAALFGPGSGNWTYQPALSLPLFDGGRTAGYEAIAEARKSSAVADYEKTIQQAFREVSDLLATRASLAEQRQAAEATIKAHQERLAVAEVRFKSGSISYLEVLDAQRELLSSQQGAVQVRRAQLGTAAQLYKALGGGDTPEG